MLINRPLLEAGDSSAAPRTQPPPALLLGMKRVEKESTVGKRCRVRPPLPSPYPLAICETRDPLKTRAEEVLLQFVQPASDNQTYVEIPSPIESISRFFSVTPPEVSVSDYIKRIMRFMGCSSSALIYAIIYCRKLEEKDARLAINRHNFHRLFITALVIAAKFIEHSWFSNRHYAHVGGIRTCKEMNRLELDMLRLLDFKLLIPLEVFQNFVGMGASKLERIREDTS